MAFTNADGLTLKSNSDYGVANKTGVTAAKPETFVLDIVGTEVPSAADPSAFDAFIPAGAYIKNAYLIVDDAFTSGGSATLTVGLYEQDGTAIDADGIDAAVALTAIDADGDVVVADGALVGGTATVGTANAYVEAIYGTAAFTGGTAKLVVEYIR